MNALNNYHFNPEKRILVLFVLPIVFVILALTLRDWHGPYWLGNNSDPEYAYLMNFLNIIQGKVPGHTDHPGTPLQILGGVIIQITYLMQSLLNHVNTNLVNSVLENPEFYLKTVSNVLIFLNALSILIVGGTAFFLSHNLTKSLLLQSTIFLWTPLIQSIRVSPEPLLFSLTQLLVSLLLFYLYSDCWQINFTGVLLGLIIGLGIATKITFFPLALVILLLPDVKQKAIAIIATLVTFFIATFPIISQYKRLVVWIGVITIHTGRYGQGEKRVVNWSAFPNTFTELFLKDPFFFYLVLFLTTFFVLLIITKIYQITRKQKYELTNQILFYWIDHKFYKLSSCVLLIILIQIFVTIKHPAIHYLMPAMGLSGLLFFLQIKLGEDYFSQFTLPIAETSTTKLQKYMVFGVIGAYFFLMTNSTSNQILLANKNYQIYLSDVQKSHDLLHQNKKCLHVSYYRSSDQEYALKFGNEFSNNQYSLSLQTIYNQSVFYNIWYKKYYSFAKELSVDILQNKECVIFYGSLLQNPGGNISTINQGKLNNNYLELEKIVMPKPLFKGNVEGLYLMKKSDKTTSSDNRPVSLGLQQK